MRSHIVLRGSRVARLCTLLVSTLALAGCQNFDRLEPDRTVAGGGNRTERGTVFVDTPRGAAGGLTAEVYQRALREISAARGEERVRLAETIWSEYPEALASGDMHELVGDAHSELGRHSDAAAAWERAIEMSWPAPDLLELPLANVELPYEVGWALYQAGEPRTAADWLVRASLISDRPQLDQGLRFLHADLGLPHDDYDAWLRERRAALAVRAPDFDLPGYRADRVRLSDRASRLTLINFWSPT